MKAHCRLRWRSFCCLTSKCLAGLDVTCLGRGKLTGTVGDPPLGYRQGSTSQQGTFVMTAVLPLAQGTPQALLPGAKERGQNPSTP